MLGAGDAAITTITGIVSVSQRLAEKTSEKQVIAKQSDGQGAHGGRRRIAGGGG